LADLDPALLPFNEDLLQYARLERDRGRRLFLISRHDTRLTRRIFEHVGIFDDVIVLCRADGGAESAQALIDRFGHKGFSYAGGLRSDLPTIAAAHSLVLTKRGNNLPRELRAASVIEAELGEDASPLAATMQAMRPHQWVKNVLIFVPIITAHAIGEWHAWAAAFVLFLAFCLTASGIYVINDLADLAADRMHPRKRLRPFAGGALSLQWGVALAIILLCLGLALAAMTSTVAVVSIYGATSIAYSWGLKQFPLVDIFLLAGLYTFRIIGGGVASGHPASLWLIAFSGFTFLSLALVKRVEELQSLIKTNAIINDRRGYLPSDLHILQTFGCASAFASSVVLALFIGSAEALKAYNEPDVLWAIVALLLFWQCRLWLSVSRGYMHHDPIVYAARDWVSWLVAATAILIIMLAAWGPPMLLRSP
jgi:4-hydroxybenzoate polyprenyltransferase